VIRKNLANSISIFITTDKVYQNFDKEVKFKENDRLGGFDPYSSSKASSELLIQSYYKSFFKDTKNMIATARAGNVIGGGDWSKYRLFPDIIRSCFEENILEIRNPNSVRPWQHVLDPLFGYLALALKLSTRDTKYCDGWNFGPESNLNNSVKEIIEIIKSKGINVKVSSPKKIYKEESKHLMLDITKAKDNLDWLPKWDTKASIYKTIDWYQRFYANHDVNELMKQNIKEYINT
jgi:CDP-glucose 4,6-dehydratase